MKPHTLQEKYLKCFTNHEGYFFLFKKGFNGDIEYEYNNRTKNRIFIRKKYFSKDFDEDFINPIEDKFGKFIKKLRKVIEEFQGEKTKQVILDYKDIINSYLALQFYRNEQNFEKLKDESSRRCRTVEELVEEKHPEIVSEFQKLSVEIVSMDKGIDGDHAMLGYHFITGDFPFHAFHENTSLVFEGERFFPFTSKLGVLFYTKNDGRFPLKRKALDPFVSYMNECVASNCNKYIVSSSEVFCGIAELSERDCYWKGIIHAGCNKSKEDAKNE